MSNIDMHKLHGDSQASKPAAPLQESVIRRVFFCPDSVLPKDWRDHPLWKS
jgi:hypothetical protein